ncbi:MAG TPA: SufD family Fe-S cluster assembly protein, partial [Bacilli bacterium]|nr:SufD family Fe-S cluster assembly protein [Bacilli bacterium]
DKIDTCVLQNSRIINLTNNKCQIKPNLFIDEYNVEASHSAYIGGFSADDMFYLNSRGINELDALKLLINGFLTKDMPKYLVTRIKRNINKYWR